MMQYDIICYSARCQIAVGFVYNLFWVWQACFTYSVLTKTGLQSCTSVDTNLCLELTVLCSVEMCKVDVLN